VWSGWNLAAVTRPEGVLSARLVRLGRTRTVAVDAVAVGHGFTPQAELAAALGCELTVDPRDGSVVAVVSEASTTVDGVYAAGELTGIGGADAAVATGTLAGLAAAHRLGRLDARAHARLARRWRRHAAAAARFATALHAVHRPPAAAIPDDTVLCRCEGTTYGAARAAIACGVDDPRALKLLTRVGMGPCQGRLCGSAAADLLGCSPEPYAHRPLTVPVPLHLLEESHD
jgi:NAD(P)H-nitrite reductase large subunit